MKTLKLFFLLLFCAISCQVVFAQKKSYPKVGATWHYHWIYEQMGTQGYYTQELTKDTLIQGKNCFEISLNQFFPKNHKYPQGKKYLLYEDDKVYQYYNEKFYLLYDFTVKTGDTIRTEVVFWDVYSGQGEFTFPVELEVTKVKEIEINGEKLISYDATPTQRTYEIDGKEYEIVFGNAIENLGYTHYFFPMGEYVEIACSTAIYPSLLNCYMNGDFYYKNKEFQKDCDYTYEYEFPLPIGIEEYDKQLYSIYINPANTTLTITGIEQYPVEYNIFNMHGSTEMNGKTGSKDIDISSLASGTYILQINNSTPASYKFVKK